MGGEIDENVGYTTLNSFRNQALSFQETLETEIPRTTKPNNSQYVKMERLHTVDMGGHGHITVEFQS